MPSLRSTRPAAKQGGILIFSRGLLLFHTLTPPYPLRPKCKEVEANCGHNSAGPTSLSKALSEVRLSSLPHIHARSAKALHSRRVPFREALFKPITAEQVLISTEIVSRFAWSHGLLATVLCQDMLLCGVLEG
ncbi:hypothetical protein N657DRAFT_273335 [Parathielavia appendiculata]|uniref:Uncharacterized protein n=1 Tax=Parathielavia appendiculata TaxID=2587402 RepID=A0AAN6U459_9PEZI|nr:hypothetical protein N657DRAFT_273335 [Parathielavia appendiculata]